MRAAVRAGFRAFTAPLEGVVPVMYTDVLGLVTTGVGNLIDPVSTALHLPWVRRSDGCAATQDEIAAEWHAVKSSRRRGSALYLRDADLDALVLHRLDANELYLSRRWANWTDWPADAQLGAHSCAWAAGPAWAAPHFDAAASAGDFGACAGTPGTDGNDPADRGHAWLRDTKPEDDARGVHGPTLNPGLRPRNLKNQALFANAARVLAEALDPDLLIGAP